MKKTLAMVLALAVVATLGIALPASTMAEAAKIEMTFVCPSWDVNPPMNDWWIWQEYEKKTNIHINWTEISPAVAAEKKTTMIASDDLPDAFWQFTTISTPELYQYGSEGLFVSLDDKADWMPNLTALMAAKSSVKPAITMPDGHIYAFPYIMDDAPNASLRYFLNKSYLSALGMETPKTLEDLEAYFQGVKDQDVNGNGDASDEVPLYVAPGGFVWTLERQLMGAFGMGSNGMHPVVAGAYLGDEGKLKFIFTDDKIKEMWSMFHDWWEKGYIHPETFSGYDYTKWVTDGTNNLVGMYSWVGANYLYDGAPADYAGVNQFDGPYSKVMSWIEPPVRGVANGIITHKCQHVQEAMQWFDYWYSEEGSNFGLLGTEGVTYNMVNGVPKYVDAILNYDGGSQLGAFQYGLFVYGGYYPYLEPDAELSRKINGKTYEEIFSSTRADLEAVLPKEMWPAFIALDSEQEVLDTYWNDIQTAINEARVKFITGELSLDDDWQAYVDQINGIGLADVMAVRQAQYERYLASK